MIRKLRLFTLLSLLCLAVMAMSAGAETEEETALPLETQQELPLSNGSARAYYEQSREDGSFDKMYPFAKKAEDQEAYQAYCEKAMDLLDEWYVKYGPHNDALGSAVFIWPLIDRELDETEEISREDYEKIVSDVLKNIGGEKVLENIPGITDPGFLTDLFMTEYTLTENGALEDAFSIIPTQAYRPAYTLLKIRALDDESVRDIAGQWAQLENEYEAEFGEELLLDDTADFEEETEGSETADPDSIFDETETEE